MTRKQCPEVDDTAPGERTRTTQRGRPRRLELDQVIEAALAVGLQRLTMSAVAGRLGVGKAVLYGYVANRAELVRIATARASRRHRWPLDNGQPWAVWILEYARALYEAMTMDGELMETWLSGEQSPILEVDSGETWLRAMTRRGFGGAEALQLRRAVSHLVIGAAAASKRDKALSAGGRPRSAVMKRAVLSRPPEDTPLLRQFIDVFARAVDESNWEYGLYVLLRGVAGAHEVLIPGDADIGPMFETISPRPG